MAYTTIDDPSAYFQTALFTGNGGTNAITNTGNSDLQPNMVWFKCRSAEEHNGIFDSVRGVTKVIYPNLNNAGDNLSDSLASFNSDGFTMGADTGSGGAFNGNNKTMAAWQWKAGTSFTNDASSTSVGDIDSSGSVNTDAGFSIITATSDGAANKDIAHGLGAVPDVIFAKNLVRQYSWDCYFKTLGYNASLRLDNAAFARTGAWGSNTFTTTTFETQEDYSSKDGEAYIYYCFAQKQGFSKFGKYTANATDVDGNFIFTGFKPAFILIKSSNQPQDGQSWFIYDSSRDPGNTATQTIQANLGTAEQTDVARIDILSNGFKFRTNTGRINGSNGEYVFMAFAEQPFVTSTGVPATAR